MSREAKLRECLDVALGRWRMYSNDDRQFEDVAEIEEGNDAEAELYRMCAAVLRNAKEKAGSG